jgi:hypothetical protein
VSALTLTETCDPFQLAVTYGTVSNCVAVQLADCMAALSVAGTTATAAGDEACAQVIADGGQTCRQYFVGLAPAACIPPPGPLPVDAGCSAGGQCSTTLCQTPSTSSCGTCQDQPDAGSSCMVLGCGRGLVCDPFNETCIRPAFDAGAPCMNNVECGVGFSCHIVAGNDGGICNPRSLLGAPCNPADGGLTCEAQEDLFCDRKGTFTCTTFTFVDAGQSCGYLDAGLDAVCALAGKCTPPGDGGHSSCVPPAADNSPCDTKLGPNCTPPSRCVLNDAGTTQGICTPLNFTCTP